MHLISIHTQTPYCRTFCETFFMLKYAIFLDHSLVKKKRSWRFEVPYCFSTYSRHEVLVAYWVAIAKSKDTIEVSDLLAILIFVVGFVVPCTCVKWFELDPPYFTWIREKNISFEFILSENINKNRQKIKELSRWIDCHVSEGFFYQCLVVKS